MSLRSWVYGRLHDDPYLLSQHEGRVYARESLEIGDLPVPFLAYGLGNSTAENLVDATSDELDAERQFFQVWAFDARADYARIDEELLPAIRRVFRGASSTADGVIAVRWLETSQEFDDQTLRAIFRYHRFQAIRRLP